LPIGRPERRRFGDNEKKESYCDPTAEGQRAILSNVP
jgi:hypothetical protein